MLWWDHSPSTCTQLLSRINSHSVCFLAVDRCKSCGRLEQDEFEEVFWQADGFGQIHQATWIQQQEEERRVVTTDDEEWRQYLTTLRYIHTLHHRDNKKKQEDNRRRSRRSSSSWFFIVFRLACPSFVPCLCRLHSSTRREWQKRSPKNRRKVLVLGLCVAVFFAVVVGCGGGGCCLLWLVGDSKMSTMTFISPTKRHHVQNFRLHAFLKLLVEASKRMAEAFAPRIAERFSFLGCAVVRRRLLRRCGLWWGFLGMIPSKMSINDDMRWHFADKMTSFRFSIFTISS